MKIIGKMLNLGNIKIKYSSNIFILFCFLLSNISSLHSENINYVGFGLDSLLDTLNIPAKALNNNLNSSFNLPPKDPNLNNITEYVTDNSTLYLQSEVGSSVINETENFDNNFDTNFDTNLPQNALVPSISNKMNILDYRYNNIQRYTVTGEMPNLKTDIKALNLGVVLGSLTAIFVLQHQAQANTIWKERIPFRIVEDGAYGLYSDKPGHVIGSYYTANTLTDALIISGVDWESSVITSGILGLAYMSYIEVLDGYGKGFGFSPSDMYANIFGAGLYVAQYYSPFLQNITPKYTYFPSNWFGQRKRQPHDFFIDDYSSQTLWLTFNMHNMLPESLANYWPDWLDVSLGYAARNLTEVYDPEKIYFHDPNVTFRNNQVEGDPKFIISLDYNLVKLLPDGGSFWNWAKQTLNFFKFPAPALEIGYDGKSKLYLIYPFPIKF
ncbi:MAG: DUF2279 domain-containing protein [Candidatus Kapaibacteriota bacterium]|jgi:hypothetical protein